MTELPPLKAIWIQETTLGVTRDRYWAWSLTLSCRLYDIRHPMFIMLIICVSISYNFLAEENVLHYEQGKGKI